MNKLTKKLQSPSVERLKTEAQRLFANRGIDGVTVRDIAKAAGQKNPAAVGYHFGSKEALIRELIIDGAKIIDDRRNVLLDALEKEGGPDNISQIVDILIYPSVNLAAPGETDTYNRFLHMLTMSHNDLFYDALAGCLNSGYQRCLEHLRKLMPIKSRKIQNQRFIFLESYLGAVLSARETRLNDQSRDHATWNDKSTLDHFSATISCMLEMEHFTSNSSGL
ncbi:TetR family transcriptional regulator [Sphingorhabdus lutea]|uniref:TetR family transcriptional regulator n=1 Tax=Sphingorhabdus lutea TaxID=1913578 RepID=A0A1L3JC48_9SPHN|nr:TetR/AcrR family transcriptional regulator [Sphingorhabdus lutea]APG62698.1 TetR family transcriptional regulator [Sphingorhabdus lutea]